MVIKMLKGEVISVNRRNEHRVNKICWKNQGGKILGCQPRPQRHPVPEVKFRTLRKLDQMTSNKIPEVKTIWHNKWNYLRDIYQSLPERKFERQFGKKRML